MNDKLVGRKDAVAQLTKDLSRNAGPHRSIAPSRAVVSHVQLGRTQVRQLFPEVAFVQERRHTCLRLRSMHLTLATKVGFRGRDWPERQLVDWLLRNELAAAGGHLFAEGVGEFDAVDGFEGRILRRTPVLLGREQLLEFLSDFLGVYAFDGGDYRLINDEHFTIFVAVVESICLWVSCLTDSRGLSSSSCLSPGCELHFMLYLKLW